MVRRQFCLRYDYNGCYGGDCELPSLYAVAQPSNLFSCTDEKLVQAREVTSFRGSKNMLNALIIHSIESGAITSVCALLELVTFLVLPDALYHVCL